MHISAATHSEHPGGRPRTGIGADPAEAEILRIYLPYTFDDDVQRQAYARKQILDLIQKPGGLADQVYTNEVNRLVKYVAPSVTPSFHDFEDKMYAHVYPHYLQLMERTLFQPENISRIVNPTGKQRGYERNQELAGIRSQAGMTHKKFVSVLSHLIISIANQERRELGLVNSAGGFSDPSGCSNWRTNETVSLDTGANTAEGEAMGMDVPAPVTEQPEHNAATLTTAVASEFPDELKEHIASIVSTMAERTEPGMDPVELAADTKDIVTWYAAERLGVIEQIGGDSFDKVFWQDPAILQKLSDKITSIILEYEKAEK